MRCIPIFLLLWGRLRPLAVTTSRRAAELPNVPTLVESGIQGVEPGSLSVQQFTQMNTAEYERFGRLIREAGIRIDG
ncbi:MAG TPA: tripartite tricarboxylate transporter substrate-binding protein [Burkholderiales bacterium]|nr:tripartite tricarboxylate transporter substrate-binding protein [Burkholderiales bacterium]